MDELPPAFERRCIRAGPLRASSPFVPVALPPGLQGALPARRPAALGARADPSGRPHPFGRSVLATVWGELAVVAANDRYEIRAYGGDGAPERIVRRDHDLRVPTRAELDAWFTESYADRSEEEQARLQALFEGMTLVEFFPAFSALQSDPPGYLWVREYRFPERTETLWTVFDAAGRVRGFVETPTNLDVFEIGDDYVLGLHVDALGVERVQVWPLDRDPG